MVVKILNSFLVFVGVPRDMDYHNIKDHLKNIKGVKAVHGLTVWCLTLEKNALAVHLAAGKQYHKTGSFYHMALRCIFFPQCPK